MTACKQNSVLVNPAQLALEELRMSLRKIAREVNFVALLLVIFVTSALVAQEPPSKVDIFAGYSWLHPGDNNHGLSGQKDINTGFTVSGTYFTNRYTGFTVDSAYHTGSTANIATVEFGPTFRFPTENITPFAHGLVGWNRMDVFGLGNADNGIGLMVGGGMDLRALKRISIRLFQADYQYAHHHYPPPGANIRPNLVGARLSTGLVFHFGEIGGQTAPASASCSVQPQEVFAGEPVTATANGSNFNPKKTINYAWSATGVKVNGTGQTANIDTAGLQPGSYQVKANLTDGTKKGVAECTASFTVKQPRAPSISCSANPSSVPPGGTSTISSNASSADNRKLTYNYTASSGTISGNDASATLNTAGAQPGTITVNCTATDDRNLSASSTTSVNVEAPPPPPPPAPSAPEASKLNQITFKKNSPRVDNTAKAILDDVALRLQRDADAKAVLVGQADPSEKGSKRIAAQRAQNTKTYLVKEKGIDPSRIEVRTGSDNAMQTDIWLIPAGATFNGQGTQVVSERAAAAPAARKSTAKKAPAKKKTP
jgi:outer membrane protein OmpA-like peptidoglycan-associated protein